MYRLLLLVLLVFITFAEIMFVTLFCGTVTPLRYWDTLSLRPCCCQLCLRDIEEKMHFLSLCLCKETCYYTLLGVGWRKHAWHAHCYIAMLHRSGPGFSRTAFCYLLPRYNGHHWWTGLHVMLHFSQQGVSLLTRLTATYSYTWTHTHKDMFKEILIHHKSHGVFFPKHAPK